jgi:enterobactin synthetase component D
VLRDIGASGPVGVNADRSPAWPAGTCGSISHSSNFTWAAAANLNCSQSVGIDTEPLIDAKIMGSIKAQIVSKSEWDKAKLSTFGMTNAQLFTAIFSAKEAFYKCVYPIENEYFGFRDAVATFLSNREVVVRRCCQKTDHNSNKSLRQNSAKLSVFIEFVGSDVFALTWKESGELSWT